MKTLMTKAWMGEKTESVPLWLMRQAGRYLPEYREVRAKAGGFLKMCYNPEIAAEITLQPLRRFQLDAAILFSDILVVPHALGLDLQFLEGEGPKLERVENAADVLRLKRDGFLPKLQPVFDAVGLIRRDLPQGKALIGFAGSPFTVASYMVHGEGGHDFGIIKAWAREDTAGFSQLIDVLVDVTAQYLIAQIKAGVDAVQIFESWAEAMSGHDFAEWVVKPNQRIVAAVKNVYPDVPFIGFPRTSRIPDVQAFVAGTGVNAVGLSQDIALADALTLPQSVCLQGNLAPDLLLKGGPEMTEQALRICEAFDGRPFVFNLGHGVIKETNPDHVAALVEVVHGYRRKELAA